MTEFQFLIIYVRGIDSSRSRSRSELRGTLLERFHCQQGIKFIGTMLQREARKARGRNTLTTCFHPGTEERHSAFLNKVINVETCSHAHATNACTSSLRWRITGTSRSGSLPHVRLLLFLLLPLFASPQRLGYTITPFAHIYNIFIIIMHKLAEAGD